MTKKITLGYLLQQHFTENPGLSARHRDDWNSKLAQFQRYIAREPTVDDLNAAVISGYMTSITDSGNAAATANNHRRLLMLLSRVAEQEGLIPKIPRVRKIREPKRIPRGFNVDEMERIIAACEMAPALPSRYTTRTTNVRTWTRTDWKILVLLIWQCGNRPTSLLSLRFKNFDGDSTIFLPGEHTKTGMDKVDRITPELAELIALRRSQRQASDNDLILEWPCCRRHFWTTFRKHILNPAQVTKAGQETSLYGILKGATSYIAREKGLNVAMEFRGHTDVRTTVHYVDPRIAKTSMAACDILPPLFAKKSPKKPGNK